MCMHFLFGNILRTRNVDVYYYVCIKIQCQRNLLYRLAVYEQQLTNALQYNNVNDWDMLMAFSTYWLCSGKWRVFFFRIYENYSSHLWFAWDKIQRRLPICHIFQRPRSEDETSEFRTSRIIREGFHREHCTRSFRFELWNIRMTSLAFDAVKKKAIWANISEFRPCTLCEKRSVICYFAELYPILVKIFI